MNLHAFLWPAELLFWSGTLHLKIFLRSGFSYEQRLSNLSWNMSKLSAERKVSKRFYPKFCYIFWVLEKVSKMVRWRLCFTISRWSVTPFRSKVSLAMHNDLLCSFSQKILIFWQTPKWNVNKLVFEILIFIAGGLLLCESENQIQEDLAGKLAAQLLLGHDGVCTKYFDIIIQANNYTLQMRCGFMLNSIFTRLTNDHHSKNHTTRK